MPSRKRTGNSGQGPGTSPGSGDHVASKQNMVGNYARGFGYGVGHGGYPYGGGRGRCFGGGRGRFRAAWRFWELTPEQELASLKNQATLLEEHISATKSRIEEIKSSGKKEGE